MTEENLWERLSAEPVIEGDAQTAFAGNSRYDLAIIGGGFTGLSAALTASALGARVLLIEANEIAHGGSGRNVGLVNAGLWLPPREIIAHMGAEHGRRLIEVLGQAPQYVFDLIKTHGIACAAQHNGTLHLAHNSKGGLRQLEMRAAQGVEIGAPLCLLSAEETAKRLASQAFAGALFDPRAGTINPLAYARGLARAAAQNGTVLACHSPLRSARYAHGCWQLSTDHGQAQAEALLLCTNAYHQPAAGVHGAAFTEVGYTQIALKPAQQDSIAKILPQGEGSWTTAPIMLSLRKAGTPGAEELVLGSLGGLTRPTRHQISRWALRKLYEIYPDFGPAEITSSWWGKIAMTQDHIPKISPFGPRAYMSYGYSGRGIGPGTLFGSAMAKLVLGGPESDLPLPLSTPQGAPLAALRRLGIETAVLLSRSLGVF